MGIIGTLEPYVQPADLGKRTLTATYIQDSNLCRVFNTYITRRDNYNSTVIARLGDGVRLDGYNYINFNNINFSHSGQSSYNQFCRFYFGVSNDSVLTSLSFNASYTDLYTSPNFDRSQKINISSLNGIYFLYFALTVSGASKASSVWYDMNIQSNSSFILSQN